MEVGSIANAIKEEKEEYEALGFDEDDVALLEEAMEQGVFESEEEVTDESGPPAPKSIGPIIPEWQNVAKEEDVQEFLEEMEEAETEEARQ